MGTGFVLREQPTTSEQAAHELFTVLRNLEARGVQQF
jgi:hypothetical protein